MRQGSVKKEDVCTPRKEEECVLKQFCSDKRMGVG